MKHNRLIEKEQAKLTKTVQKYQNLQFTRSPYSDQNISTKAITSQQLATIERDLSNREQQAA
jgi:hypothetical protein